MEENAPIELLKTKCEGWTTEGMRWFLVSYLVHYPAEKTRHDFACVRAWNRREAYFEVINPLHEAAREIHGRRVILWDSDEIKEQS
jgi:hypothetical protein